MPALAALLLAVAPTLPPVIINSSGRLLDQEDVALTGTTTIKFAIFDAVQAGAEVWSDTFTVSPFHGAYAVQLGDTTITGHESKGLTASHFTGDRWLEITVNGDTLAPRLRIGSLPRAVYAGTAAAVTNGTATVALNENGKWPAESLEIPANLATLDGNGRLPASALPLTVVQSTGGLIDENAIPDLDASILTTGTLPNGRLSGTYTGALTFTGALTADNTSNHFGGTFAGTHTGDGTGLTLPSSYASAVNFSNSGNQFSGTFDGTFTGNGTGLTLPALPIATSSQTGVVKAGAHLTVDGSGLLAVANDWLPLGGGALTGDLDLGGNQLIGAGFSFEAESARPAGAVGTAEVGNESSGGSSIKGASSGAAGTLTGTAVVRRAGTYDIGARMKVSTITGSTVVARLQILSNSVSLADIPIRPADFLAANQWQMISAEQVSFLGSPAVSEIKVTFVNGTGVDAWVDSVRAEIATKEARDWYVAAGKKVGTKGAWCGTTTTTSAGRFTSGSLVGYQAAKAICETLCGRPEARMCTGDELLAAGAAGQYSAFSGAPWISSGNYSEESGYNMRDCIGFTVNTGSGTEQGLYAVYQSGNENRVFMDNAWCDNQRSIPCCR